MENVSLYRVEESEVEQELRAVLELASPGDPGPMVPAQDPPQEFLEIPQNPAQDVEPSSSVPDPAPQILNGRDPPAQPPNDMQVDQPNVTPTVALSHDKTSTISVPPANSTPAMTKSGEGLQPVSEPLQLPSWSPTGFLGDSDEDEEEIPSINMDSDSDVGM